MKRFWDKVEKTDTCWVWVAALTDDGYGRIEINRKKKYAHRVAWEIRNGSIPEGKQINHTCNNRKCVNPEHLYVGTQQQNMKDMIKDGTANRGERCHLSKLTEENVKTIKWLLGLGALQKDLAVIYRVWVSVISRIKTGKRWGHV